MGSNAPDRHLSSRLLILTLVSVAALALSILFGFLLVIVHQHDDNTARQNIVAAEHRLELSFCAYLRARAAVPPIPGQEGVNELNRQAAHLADGFGCPP